MRTRWVIVPLVLGALAPGARAIDVANGKLSVNGFGEWGYGRTWNENAYLLGTEDGSYENVQFGLTFTARPQQDLVVAGQLFVATSGEVSLDWGFAEWRASDLFRLRVGKVRNPFGLFMEVKDIGTLRPFFTLPQSVYGPTDFSAEAYLGAGLTGEWQGQGGWGISYDAYFGALEVPSFEPGAAVEAALGVNGPGTPPYVFADFPQHEALATEVVGGRVALLTPLEGLTLRASGFTGKFDQPDETEERMVCYGFSAEYALERLQLRGEWFRATEGEAETHLGGYAEAAVYVLPRVQLAVRYEETHQTDGDVPAQFRTHREGAVGLAFWPSPNLAVKASYHRVDGNRFAVPEQSAPDGSVDRRTDLFLAGAQFSF